MVNVNFSKLISAPEFVQMSPSITRTSSGDGARRVGPWEGSGIMIHQEALKNWPACSIVSESIQQFRRDQSVREP